MDVLLFLDYGILFLVIWIVLTFTYRIYFHPLSEFLGPKLAAISRFYEWYVDCTRPGIHYQKLHEWHIRYGPIVRIGPNEVHIDDPDWFNVLYNPNTKLDKDPWAYSILGSHDAASVTVEHHVHRVKRSKQNPFFSRWNVDRSAPLLAKVLQNLFDRFEFYRASGKPVEIRNALKSFVTDVVCQFTFLWSMDFVKSPDFSATYHKGQESLVRNALWVRHVPLLAKILNSAPRWSIQFMNKETQACLRLFKFIECQVEESVWQNDAGVPETKKTIIRKLNESSLPTEYRTRASLTQEAFVFVSAGAETTSRAIEGGIFHILNNPVILRRLTEEVRGYLPEQTGLITHRQLESLTYLRTIVLETLRMFTAITSRLPRINRAHDMFYNDWRIPRGSIVGMSPFEILRDDRVWGNAEELEPERWLDPERKSRLQKYMLTFGRGARNCIEQNLAVAEIYVVIGNLFRSFDVELFETDIREIECVQDCFTPRPYRGSNGVRVLLKSRVDLS